MTPFCTRLFLLASLLIIAIAPAAAQESETLTVYAAASLTDAFETIAVEFEAANPGVDIIFNFGNSSTLAAQLAEGAPADVFASANSRQMDVAREAGRIGAPPVTFVRNRLVIVVPADNPAGIQTVRDLANEDVLLILVATGAPIRDYTDNMLALLAADPAFGESYREAVLSNLVSEESTVRQATAKIALGEADAAIVYTSDVTPDIADAVLSLPIPDSINTIAAYPIAITDDTPNPELAQAFVDFVLADAGQDILVDWGFISARIPEQPPTITLVEDGLLHVGGQVLNPLALSVEDLQTRFTPQTLDVTYRTGGETASATFTGVPLWDILNAAQVNVNPDIPGDLLSLYIVASATDNVQAVVSWAEVAPDYGNQPVLVAYEGDGGPLPPDQGSFRLIVPSDLNDGRYVDALADLSVRDAPGINRR